ATAGEGAAAGAAASAGGAPLLRAWAAAGGWARCGGLGAGFAGTGVVRAGFSLADAAMRAAMTALASSRAVEDAPVPRATEAAGAGVFGAVRGSSTGFTATGAGFCAAAGFCGAGAGGFGRIGVATA